MWAAEIPETATMNVENILSTAIDSFLLGNSRNLLDVAANLPPGDSSMVKTSSEKYQLHYERKTRNYIIHLWLDECVNRYAKTLHLRCLRVIETERYGSRYVIF